MSIQKITRKIKLAIKVTHNKDEDSEVKYFMGCLHRDI